MKKNVFFLVCGVLFFICGCEEEHRTEIKVIGVSPLGDVKIDAGKKITQNGLFEAPRKYNIFSENDMVVARILITQTFPDYSIGTIVSRMDGCDSKPNIHDISKDMICRETTKENIKTEKKVYKYQKKALKRQYKLTKIKAKREVYESLDKIVQDPNEIGSIKAGLIKVEKK